MSAYLNMNADQRLLRTYKRKVLPLHILSQLIIAIAKSNRHKTTELQLFNPFYFRNIPFLTTSHYGLF